MNLILFEAHELDAPLSRRDRRATHILQVLRRHVGDTFDAGLVNGPRGRGTVTAIEAHAIRFTFAGGDPPPPLDPLSLLIGLPRPQTARDILRDATTMGVAALHFFTSEKGEPNYARSTLWSSDEWRRQLILGAEQAFDTRLPDVTHGRPLAACIGVLPPAAARIALDNYESPQPLAARHLMDDKPVVLAFGPERGWSAAERALLRASGFACCHLGSRVLRSETAVVVALGLVRAKLGLLG